MTLNVRKYFHQGLFDTFQKGIFFSDHIFSFSLKAVDFLKSSRLCQKKVSKLPYLLNYFLNLGLVREVHCNAGFATSESGLPPTVIQINFFHHYHWIVAKIERCSETKFPLLSRITLVYYLILNWVTFYTLFHNLENGPKIQYLRFCRTPKMEILQLVLENSNLKQLFFISQSFVYFTGIQGVIAKSALSLIARKLRFW